MLKSIPLPWQAILWPLCGTALILALRRFLPNWLCRLVALAAALASLAALWSLRSAPAEPVTIFWEPLNFFRLSPTLLPTRLALFLGITMAVVVAALALGIQGAVPQKTNWHGLILVALAGCLLLALAANLLTLALGSALLDLALVALAISSPGGADRAAWRMAVPGLASTLLLVFGAVHMDATVGSASLTARDFPVEILVLMGLAGLLRLLVFPLHPRGLATAENAALQLLSVGAGVYLLTCAQTIGPVLSDRPWLLLLGGVGLLAGGLLAWAAPAKPISLAEGWSGMAMHQTGLLLAFVLLLRTAASWSWLGLMLPLALLAVWWDGAQEREPATLPRWLGQIGGWLQPWLERGRVWLAPRLVFLDRWRTSPLRRQVVVALPLLGLLSLAGVPGTAGLLSRWRFYAVLLSTGRADLLLVVMVADSLLVAGLWVMLGQLLRTARTQRLPVSGLLAMLALTILLLATGIAPGKFGQSLGMNLPGPPPVSAWGLGLLFILPWLVGGWLAHLRARLGQLIEFVRHFVQLEWLFRLASRLGQGLAGSLYWLGLVGEGEGWWGWALIILALSAIFLTIR